MKSVWDWSHLCRGGIAGLSLIVMASCAGGPVEAQPAPRPPVASMPPAIQPPPQHEIEILAKDFALFKQWFAGRFDNDLQVFFERDLGVREDVRHERIHSIFFPVIGNTTLGPDTFYVEQYSDNDPAKIYRQRVYRFVRDDAAVAIRLEIYTPTQERAAALVGAWRDPSKLSGLTLAEMTRTPGCDVFWKRQENQFVGHVREGACRIPSRRDGRMLVISDDLVLTENSIWISDRAVDERGEYVFGNRAGVPHKLQRANMFSCWVATLAGAKHGDSGVGLDDWTFQRDLLIHDQGGVLPITTPDGRSFFLKLRAVEWPYGTNRPSLTLYVHQAGNDRALSYAWGEIDAERLGINLRWLQASCTRAPEAVWR
jgi:hypothetical protein